MPRVLPHIGMSGKPADASASWSRYTGLAARDRTPGSGATPTYGVRTPETSAAARPSAACGTPEDTIAPHPRPHPPGCRTRSRTWQHKQIPLRTASARRAGPSLRSGKRGGIHRPDGPVLPTYDAAVLRTARAGCPKPEGPAARWGISPRPPHRLQHHPALALYISSQNSPGRLCRRRCGLLASLRWRRLLHRILCCWRLRFPRGRRDRRGQRGQVHDRVIPAKSLRT